MQQLALMMLLSTTLWAEEPVLSSKPRIGLLVIDERLEDSWSFLMPFAELIRDPEIQAIILAIEADMRPGVASACMRDVQTLKKLYPKPIIAYSEDQLNNGRYILSCAADRIMTYGVAQVGKIGLGWGVVHQHDKNSQEGNWLTVIHAGDFKTANERNLSPDLAAKEHTQKQIAAAQDYLAAELIKIRPSLERSKNSWMQGEFYIGSRALHEFAMVDKVGDKLDLLQLVAQLINAPSSLPESFEFVPKACTKKLWETQKNEEKKKRSVAILQITEITIHSWKSAAMLLQLFSDPAIQAIILELNCHGSWQIGTSFNLYHDIKKLKQQYHKPVVTFIDGDSLSAGYLMACTADTLIASPISWIGSVGVRYDRWDQTQKNIKEYLSYYPVSSGKFVDIDNPNVALTAEGKEMIQQEVDAVHEKFILEVKQSRPNLTRETENLWKEAQIYCSSEAKKIGLIDRIGSPLDALEQALGRPPNFDELDLIFTKLPEAPQEKK